LKSLDITNIAYQKALTITGEIDELTRGVEQATGLAHENKKIADNLIDVSQELNLSTAELEREINIFKV
jgi:methyl-accepting chemotaxis protein